MASRTFSHARTASVPCGLPPTPLPNSDTAHRTVLLVEDDETVLTMVSQTLTSLGHKVVEARDGQEALQVVRRDPTIDYLFTDIVMPNGMNGVQLMNAARAERPGLRALLTSARPREEVRALGTIPYDVAFLPKPYSLTEVHAFLRWGTRNPRPALAEKLWSLDAPPAANINTQTDTEFSDTSCQWVCWT